MADRCRLHAVCDRQLVSGHLRHGRLHLRPDKFSGVLCDDRLHGCHGGIYFECIAFSECGENHCEEWAAFGCSGWRSGHGDSGIADAVLHRKMARDRQSLGLGTRDGLPVHQYGWQHSGPMV